MMRFMRFRSRGAIALQPAGRAAAVLLASLAGGCSASVSGFDFPSFSLNDDRPQQTASASGRGNPSYLGNDGYGSGGYSAPRTYRESSVSTQNLPDATPSSPSAYSGGRYGDNYAAANPRSDTNNYGRSATNGDRGSAANSYGRSPSHNSYTDSGRYGTVAPASTASTNRYDPQPTPSRASPGDAIEVQSGDTLYGLSRRYNVSVAELMQINNLTSTNLALGQRLYLPQGTASNRYGTPPPTQTASIHPPPAPPPGDHNSRYSGTYTVQPGDSLYGISRNFGVPVGELQRANGITDARGVKAGTVLRVPDGSGGSTNGAIQQVVVTPPAQHQQYSAPSYSPPQQPAPQQAVAQSNDASSQPTIINGSGNGGGTQYTQVATRNSNNVAAGATSSPRQSSGSDKLRWPVSGRIITGFGQRADGTHNDGINLSVPLGTSVHAAESGTVAYAGAELKGYGNLVLLRHDNGWVTAYAHNDQLMVKRGDKVQRGQVIATAGRTGSVDQPQVHFELRQGSKPVDPVPFLERL